MTIKLDSSGKKYIRFMTWGTFWARQTAANPGTAINGVPKASWSDFSLRQFRFVTYSQLSPRYLILADIGIDNQAFSTGGAAGGGNTGNGGQTFAGTLGKKPELYLHDLWNEYAIIPDKDPNTGRNNKASLYVGTGLHYWNGISRLTSAGSANYLAVDVPLYNWPLVDLSDQFARQLGVYFKGNLGPVSYRWAVNKPFTVLSSPAAFPHGSRDSSFAVDNNATGKIATTGYATWQFFEKENNLLPYFTGTYVGTKKVFNIGAGYYSSAEGTVTQAANSASSALIRHAINLWSVDAFADLPFGGKENWAFTGYSVFYHYDFGPNYLRYGSIMNENVSAAPNYNGSTSQAGFGNAAPIIGTGTSWFTQIGLLLPKTILNGKTRFQTFGEYSRQKFDRFGNASFTYWSAGGNIYLDGHHARISLKYQTRPIVVADRQESSKGSFIIATQIYL
ncbi:porin [Mucilaginibacter psychrotolerans]|uniref:Porin n=1 Tax=Mucilaginibacter psychrotolerans TaxID=1524096 RepID=A0A4Y8SFU3_9SPHI|nr:porin [Mucilaginibacter psychrotolerans]TFF37778.1 porin [Mucilaginibacter psychrotolerans]